MNQLGVGDVVGEGEWLVVERSLVSDFGCGNVFRFKKRGSECSGLSDSEDYGAFGYECTSVSVYTYFLLATPDLRLGASHFRLKTC